MNLTRRFELISTMQKAIRRRDEKLSMRVALELVDTGCHKAVANRLRVTAHEDIGLAGGLDMLVALRSIDDFEAWAKDKNDAWRLALANAILVLSRATKCREADEFQAACQLAGVEDGPAPVPDYALDKHTRRGKAMGRGMEHFLEVGAHLEGTFILSPYVNDAHRFWLDPEAMEKAGDLATTGSSSADKATDGLFNDGKD